MGLKDIYKFTDVGSMKFWFTGEIEEDDTAVAVPQSVHEQEDGVILAICATGNVYYK